MSKRSLFLFGGLGGTAMCHNNQRQVVHIEIFRHMTCVLAGFTSTYRNHMTRGSPLAPEADQTKPAKLPDPNESMPPPAAPPAATNGMNGMAPPWQHGQHPHAHAPSTPNGCQHLETWLEKLPKVAVGSHVRLWKYIHLLNNTPIGNACLLSFCCRWQGLPFVDGQHDLLN